MKCVSEPITVRGVRVGGVELAAELHLAKTNGEVKIANQGRMHASHIGETYIHQKFCYNYSVIYQSF